ncbi:serine/threonine-protein kinase AFC1-like isoform X1 [Coffea arabica]|uniref:Serine/threonine-protein kinase AFC1-like isoform X1 n=2 Tax=Coffea arabica TaxID=13443 RepID=A0ABM4UT13_COFAR|nr:serine/threonine-protein kinase AFC1-like isoform X2 [Coffea arabica]
METQKIADFPYRSMDKRPRKRPRLTWDMPPPLPPPSAAAKVLPTIYYGQQFANGLLPNYAYSSIYYKGASRNGSPPWRSDDKDGHYVFAIGENLTPRYRILSKMGEGTFGQVLECLDNERKEIVAIKVVRSVHKYREAAMIEIDVLHKLLRHDVGGARCVQIRNWFDYRNHICIVFEKLGPSLYDFLRKNSYRSFPIDLVREFGRQLLESVAFMHDLRLIHTDLKPENILLVSSEYVKVPDYKFLSRSIKDGSYFKNLPKSSAIKLIDFGSTTFEHQDHSYVVSTRHYRAPEVILGLGWNYPCDMWSVGCILVELCSGEALFQTHENLEHLAMMERVLGPLPQHMIMRADHHAVKYFKRGARLDWPEGATSRESMRAVWKLPRLQNLVMQHVDHSAGDLIDLLQGLLRYEPGERLKAREALRHPFFNRNFGRVGYSL